MGKETRLKSPNGGAFVIPHPSKVDEMKQAGYTEADADVAKPTAGVIDLSDGVDDAETSLAGQTLAAARK